MASGEEHSQAKRPWDGISVADAEEVNFEAVLSTCASADCRELAQLFRQAAQSDAVAAQPSCVKVYSVLAEICDFHFRPDNQNAPFAAKIAFGNKRSSVPEDFRGDVEAIARLAERANNSPLRARLCDVAWLLNKRRVDLGIAAMSAYAQIVKDLKDKKIEVGSEGASNPVGWFSRELLHRALYLASLKSVGKGKPEAQGVQELARSVALLAAQGFDPHAVTACYGLCAGFIEPAEIAQALGGWLAAHPDCDIEGKIAALRFQAFAFRKAKMMEDHDRTRHEVAETIAELGELRAKTSAIVGAKFLSEAISELQDVRNTQEKRKELRRRLIAVQSSIPDEMVSFTDTIDLSEAVGWARQQVEGRNLRDAMFAFACIEQSPDPEKNRIQAREQASKFVLSSLFDTSIHDRDGKTVHRAPGALAAEEHGDEALEAIIARNESIRRTIAGGGAIQTGRIAINANYYVAEDTFRLLVAHSPFVPQALEGTYCRGFAHFFQGDFISALYILVPLLEASIKFLLKQTGFDVSTFDNATQTQQEMTISGLFEQNRSDLDKVLGQAIATDIDGLFLSKAGPSLRHGVAHGLLTDNTPYTPDAMYACWLIYHLCVIPLVRCQYGFDEDLTAFDPERIVGQRGAGDGDGNRRRRRQLTSDPEPPRVCRRPQLVRSRVYDKQDDEQILS